jgi:large subunit ribosomal protein L17
MRHGKKHNHLSRTTSHRHALLRNMASSLIVYKRIETTVAKAKELRKFVEPILTRSKEDTTHNRRVIFSYIPNKEIIKELFSAIADKIADRPGGYTRIIKLGQRSGDAAEMCMIELVDFNETMLAAVTEKTAKTRRSRRGGKKEGTDAQTIEVAEVKSDVIVEAVSGVDDLKIVEGIGPKIAEAFITAGVTTFAQVSEMSSEAMNEIITAAGISSKNTETWAKQAELARDGKLDELKAWQDELNAGKE